MSAYLNFSKLLKTFHYSVASGIAFSTLLARFCAVFPLSRRLKIYPRLVRAPDGSRFFVGDILGFFACYDDQYLRHEYELLSDFIPRKGWIILDVGAHIGIYSIRVSKLVGDSGLVCAFEPNPLTYYWLRENVFLNGANNIRTFPIALGNKNRLMKLHVVLTGYTGLSSIMYDHIVRCQRKGARVGEIKTITIPMYTLDYLVEKLNLPKQYDLVKIDVEGAELNVLEGMRSLMQGHKIKRLVIEIHTDVIDENQVLRILKKHHYRPVKLVSYGDNKKIGYFSIT